jgi:glycosyltransferase involved in cell wall biosynthesis
MSQRIECYLNARFLSQGVTGVQRTATEMVKALDEVLDSTPGLTDQIQVTMLAPPNSKHDLGLRNVPVRVVGRLTGHAWEQFELPWYSHDGMLISLCNTAPLAKRQQMVMLHDASCFVSPMTYSFAFRWWYRVLHPCLGLVCRRVMTVSEFSARELEKHAHIKAQKLVVVNNGGEHILANQPDWSILECPGDQRRPYILAVSSMSPNKNFRSLMKAMEHIDNRAFDVVVAGGTNPRIFREQDIQIPDTVKYLGYVSDSQLRALYEGAMGFIYPSTYEGFGLPPIEAMTCGCPVIVSDIPPLREVCGEAALYCNPYEPTDIAQKMVQLSEDAVLRSDLIHKGRERAERYTWRRAAWGLLGQLGFQPTEEVVGEMELNR